MHILEQLYDAARDHLEEGRLDWQAFAGNFRWIFDAHCMFYRVRNDERGWEDDSLEIIATTDEPVVRKCVELGFHRQMQIRESELPSLEPARRTDMFPDEEFRKLGAFYDFFSSNGLFYMMIVPARLSDGTDLSFLVWRDEAGGDFSDAEKMRLGLFVRYLMKTVDTEALVHQQPNDKLRHFGATFDLTRTEIEILSYLLEGYSLKAIAAETGRTYGTVRWHIRNLLEKCQVKSQTNLLRQFYALIEK